MGLGWSADNAKDILFYGGALCYPILILVRNVSSIYFYTVGYCSSSLLELSE